MENLIHKISNWRSRYFGPCTFACVAVQRDNLAEPSCEELDELVQMLPQHIDFEGSFHKTVDLHWPPEPIASEYDSEDEYQHAYDEYFQSRRFEPKPWAVLMGDMTKCMATIEDEILSVYGKQYTVTSESGETRTVSSSQIEIEKKQIAEQQSDHEELIAEFMGWIKQAFQSAEKFWLFESDHLLDVENQPERSRAEAYSGGFYDRTLVFASNQIAVLIWTGSISAYG